VTVAATPVRLLRCCGLDAAMRWRFQRRAAVSHGSSAYRPAGDQFQCGRGRDGLDREQPDQHEHLCRAGLHPPRRFGNRYQWRSSDIYHQLVRDPQNVLLTKVPAHTELRYAEIRAWSAA
jgi:hypothetical protein